MASALVVFHPVNPWGAEESLPYATTDADGRFSISTYAVEDGAPAGDYKVCVRWIRGENEQGAGRGGEDNPRQAGPKQLPAPYGRPETSDLHVRVSERPNDLEPFQLKSGRGGPAKPPSPPVID